MTSNVYSFSSSFRLLFYAPFFSATACLVTVLIHFAIKALVDKLSGESVKSNKSDMDVALGQFVSLGFTSSYFPMMIHLPSSFICLAYGYDADQAGLTRVEEEEADAIIKACEVNQEKNKAGKFSILLSAVADVPTFKAAFGTLITVQALGILFEIIAGWPFKTIFPKSESDFDGQVNFILISLWPFLSLFIIPSVMIASVHLQSDRTFKSLWTYGETTNDEQESASVNESEKAADDMEKLA